MSEKATFRVQASRKHLAPIEQKIKAFALSEDWPVDLVFKIHLVIEEIGINIIEHGYANDESKAFDIVLESGEEVVTIQFVDEARPFDPLNDTPEPDLEAGLEDRQIGGLGIHLVREMMDEVSYARVDNLNKLTLWKRR